MMKKIITLHLLLIASLFSFGQDSLLKLSVTSISIGKEKMIDGSLDTVFNAPELLSQKTMERSTLINDGNIYKLLVEVENGLVDSTYTLRLKNYPKSGEYATILFKSNKWKNSKILIDKQYFQKLGLYSIEVAKEMSIDKVGESAEGSAGNFDFEVVATETEKNTSNILYALIIGAIIGGLLILRKNKQTKKKLAAEVQQKDIARLHLKAVRSQLNPHFLFNALAGIQNLMNKNEIDNANKYLSKFARLTRNVLDDKELIGLSQEKTLLDDYLQMEQLRFGFKYEINCSENLDLDNIEIPSMLLQPFVENAVKHGVSKKSADGKINITFLNQANDLILTVIDNGNGFDKEKRNNGLGMQLSESRIALLNSVYKENRFKLTIQSSTSGAEVSLTLTDWL